MNAKDLELRRCPSPEFVARTRVARLLGHLNGVRVFRYPVVVTYSNLYGNTHYMTDVVATDPRNAASAVRAALAPVTPDVFTTTVIGPRGGLLERFSGWTSIIGTTLLGIGYPPAPVQLNLNLEKQK